MPLPIVTHDVHEKIVEEAIQAVLSTVEALLQLSARRGR
jgi:hypothetical protein